jgi:pimeloyl-ACP methyl ester carboxylesterase
MTYVEVEGATIWVEEVGSGPPLVCLHSGWGRAVMPFDAAVARLGGSHRMLFPDRRGYGRSTPLERLSIDFHAEAARDLAAVIEFLFAAERPESPRALVLESIHFWRAKSRAFFERYAREPESLPDAVRERLAADHGERWPDVVRMHSRVWLDFQELGGDFYGGRLAAIRAPTLIVHGEADPHTPVEEVEEVARRIARNDLFVVAGGGHSPHSEATVADAVVGRVERFLDGLD